MIMAYDEKYFDWQKSMGEFGGIVNQQLFSPFIASGDSVLEFGCGGGYLLNGIKCNQKIGIEINPSARNNAREMGLNVFEHIADVPDDFADVVISNHVLEHVNNPISTLQDLYPKIKINGKLVFIVPHEKASQNWHPSDINQHLYTWNPMTLGNLFQRAGYEIISVERIWLKWPPKFDFIYKLCGETLFHLICKIEAFRTNTVQIRVTAKKIN
jgi:SAM-dependent methyltransferase